MPTIGLGFRVPAIWPVGNWMGAMFTRNSMVVMAVLGFSLLLMGANCRKASLPNSAEPDGAPTHSKAPVLDEKVKAMIVELTARWDELQAFSAAVDTELPQAAGNPGKTRGKGSYEWVKRGAKRLIRFGLVNTILIDHGQAKRTRTGEILVFVYDGEFLYSQLQQPKDYMKTTKSRYEPDRILQIGGQDLFRGLVENNFLKLGSEETIDGRAVYVLEATSTTGKGSAVHYFDKLTGAQLKMIVRDETGNAKLTVTLTEINTTPEFSEDYFSYKLPEGFELIDKTKD